MAKQTFSTGQVLTSAQMTALQANDYNWTVNAKTASYVLVATDAGTRVTMNSGSATTITVNTGLFTAGDVLEIINLGAGVCTITAGTATVSTSATLALKQYDAGSLFFNSAGAAVFISADAADSTSPLTTKGDVYTYSTADARLAVGANDTVLTADSTAATGLKWATPAAGTKTMTQIASGNTTSGTSVQVTGLSSYDTIVVRWDSAGTTAGTPSFGIGVNNSTTLANYNFITLNTQISSATQSASSFNLCPVNPSQIAGSTNYQVQFTNCKAAGFTNVIGGGYFTQTSGNITPVVLVGTFVVAAAVSSLEFVNGGNTFNRGTYTIWGG